jgi:hypothetical protein
MTRDEARRIAVNIAKLPGSKEQAVLKHSFNRTN